MDLAACDASGRGRGNGSEHTASRRGWRRDIAHGCLLYLVPTIIFFVVYAIGLWRLPGDFSGMYGNDDGIWAAWNLRGIFEWSRPFDLAPFNPLSGMGSTFLPNTPWLNPAALALAGARHSQRSMVDFASRLEAGRLMAVPTDFLRGGRR